MKTRTLWKTLRMMKIKRILPLLLLSMFLPWESFSQEKDFGIWYSINAEMELAKKLEIDFWGNLRTFRNASKIEEGFGEAGLTYKILKNLSIGGKYRFTMQLEDDDVYHPRHKWIGDLKANRELGNFEFSGRIRFQRQDKTYFEDKDDEIPDYYTRFRLKTEYKTRSFPVNPFASFETFSRVFETAEKTIEKTRFSLGMEYSIGKKHSVELEYMYQHDTQPKLYTKSIIGINYSLKL